MVSRIGIYPGTFDPVTNGHMDIVERALHVVDQLIVAVAANSGLEIAPLFSVPERMEMVASECLKIEKNPARLKVKPFDCLLIDFVREEKATMIMRGLRAVTDFEYEFQMAGMNAHLAPDLETVFLMASDKFQLISSRFVKEIARLGGDVSHFVSPAVSHALQRKFRNGAITEQPSRVGLV